MADNQVTRSAIFARHVKQLREERGWSQAELGRSLGAVGHPLGQSRVAAIEATGSVTIDQAAAYAAVLGVPVEMLLYEEPPATRAVQLQGLFNLAERAGQLRDDIVALMEAIGEGMPGRLPS